MLFELHGVSSAVKNDLFLISCLLPDLHTYKFQIIKQLLLFDKANLSKCSF